MTITEEDFKILEDLETKLWEAKTRFNKKWMENVLSPTFFEFGRSGRTYNREQILSVKGNSIQSELPLKNFAIRLINENIAQVTYISIVNYEEGLEKGLRSSIWQRTANGWLLEFHQGTPLYST